MAEYSKRDIANIIGRSQRNITYWTDFGLVIPDIQPSQGRGIARIYSDRNLVEFGMIDIMNKDFGVNLDTIQEILKVLRDGKLQKQSIGYMFSKEAEEKRRKGIMEYEEQEFRDFYQNAEWGESKELLAIEGMSIAYETISGGEKKTLDERKRAFWGISFHVVDVNFDFNKIFKAKNYNDGKIVLASMAFQKILRLGSIKIAAANKLGIS